LPTSLDEPRDRNAVGQHVPCDTGSGAHPSSGTRVTSLCQNVDVPVRVIRKRAPQ
jgi:hypothetical protein